MGRITQVTAYQMKQAPVFFINYSQCCTTVGNSAERQQQNCHNFFGSVAYHNDTELNGVCSTVIND